VLGAEDATVWGGHSCPPLLSWTFSIARLIYSKAKIPKFRINFKGGGQECPPPTFSGVCPLAYTHLYFSFAFKET